MGRDPTPLTIYLEKCHVRVTSVDDRAGLCFACRCRHLVEFLLQVGGSSIRTHRSGKSSSSRHCHTVFGPERTYAHWAHPVGRFWHRQHYGRRGHVLSLTLLEGNPLWHLYLCVQVPFILQS